MRIEAFHNITIAYMRNTGEYGVKNKALMHEFKNYLTSKQLFHQDTTILGIALDNPAATPAQNLRYDVGIILHENQDIGLSIRTLDDGNYAVYETAHTKEGVLSFWQNIARLTEGLPVDPNKPIIERYAPDKVAESLCEFCIPLK